MQAVTSDREPPGDVSDPRESEGSLVESLLATGYPAELECDVVDKFNVPLHLRPVRSDDAGQLVAFHARLSPGSIYRRYFAARPLLTPQEVSHLTQVDYLDRLALVILDGDEIVAIGRYERIPSTATGEVAFVVRDDFQHRGLGHLLLAQLAHAAWSRGLTKFSAITLLENRGMIAIFEHSGFPVSTSHRDEEYYVSFSINPAERVAPRRDARRPGAE